MIGELSFLVDLIVNEKLHITSQQETLKVAWENIKRLKHIKEALKNKGKIIQQK